MIVFIATFIAILLPKIANATVFLRASKQNQKQGKVSISQEYSIKTENSRSESNFPTGKIMEQVMGIEPSK